MPATLQINAWAGQPAPASKVAPIGSHWAAQPLNLVSQLLKPGALADRRNWRDPRVGWGVVLRDRDDLSDAEKARAEDAPEPLRILVERRGAAPVLRYRPDLPLGVIRRYYADAAPQDLSLVGSARGVARGQLPCYLLLYGPPTALPWALQYRLQAVAFVGRLDLEAEALSRYIDALLGEWGGAGAAVSRHAVVWAVDHGSGDITSLMRDVVAAKVAAKLAGDDDLREGARFLDGRQGGATCQALTNALVEQRPGLIVTTSHGMTGPLDDVPRMAAQLGLLVDEAHACVDAARMLATWQPAGAIWYAHACCSAGASSATAYAGLVSAGSSVDEILRGVTAVGDVVAPLPRALLGADRPLRAFIGHVEPTFDWTLRHPKSGQILTTSLVEALYDRLFQPGPIGWALEVTHTQGSQLELIHRQARTGYAGGVDTLEDMLASRLLAQDHESLVILGDPTVALPALS